MRTFDELDQDQKYLLELLGDDRELIVHLMEYAMWRKNTAQGETFTAPGSGCA